MRRIAYNTRMRKLFSGIAAFVLAGALMIHAQPPNAKGGKGRGGFAPKNLQVRDGSHLPELDAGLRGSVRRGG